MRDAPVPAMRSRAYPPPHTDPVAPSSTPDNLLPLSCPPDLMPSHKISRNHTRESVSCIQNAHQSTVVLRPSSVQLGTIHQPAIAILGVVYSRQSSGRLFGEIVV